MLPIMGIFLTRAACQNNPAIGIFTPLLGAANVEFFQIRGRKRGKRNPSKAQRMRVQQIKEENLARKLKFMKRLRQAKIDAMRTDLLWPPRYDAIAEKNLGDIPQNDVYFTNRVKTRFYPLLEALEMHRRLQSPQIFGNKEAMLKLRMELNMTTEKATKFVGASRQLVSLPYPIKHKEKRTILAFTPEKEMQEQALEAGADLALGPEAIKKILKGKFLLDDYDFCIAHESMAKDILPLRGLLKTRFPTKVNGGIGPDLLNILAKFLAGTNLIVKPTQNYPQYGLSEPIVGKLDMTNEQIMENVETIVSIICRQRNPALGPFINRALLMIIPGNAFYSVDVTPWEPDASAAEKERVEKKKNKKKKKEKSPEETDEAKKIKSEASMIMEKWKEDQLLGLM